MHTTSRGPRPPRYWFRRASGVFILVVAIFGMNLFELVFEGRSLDETAVSHIAFQQWPVFVIGGALAALLAAIGLRSMILHRGRMPALNANESPGLSKLPIAWSLTRWLLVLIYGCGLLAFSMVGAMGIGLVPAAFCLCMAGYAAIANTRTSVVIALIILATLVGLTWGVLVLTNAAAYAR
ncbi:hypothetical protein DFO48_106302 [Comamonas sp. AG1104]|nr:hypothetical protein DFO48_106302 [Comamonas sp. AG1104]